MDNRRIEPSPGQESVWDYPRPPRLDPSPKLVVIRDGDVIIARTRGAIRVLETSHPPTWYLPPADIAPNAVVRSAERGTICEWKGPATYWDVSGPGGRVLRSAAWSYQRPTPAFRSITGYLAFYPTELTCEVDGERARPQAGGFYGGWVTDDIVGPFKGEPGSWGW